MRQKTVLPRFKIGTVIESFGSKFSFEFIELVGLAEFSYCQPNRNWELFYGYIRRFYCN